MTDRKPLVAIDGRVYQIPYTSDLSVPGNVDIDYGNVNVNGRALPRWGVPQRNRSASASNNWIDISGVPNQQYRSVCWAPELGLFCAVATLGSVMTSPDGILWTLRTTPFNNGITNNGWKSVCWAPELGLFCAVASISSTNVVMTSSDGITWALKTPPTTNGFQSVCWASELGLFCAVGTVGPQNVMISTDGSTWLLQTGANTNAWNSVCWAPEIGLFCAVSTTGSNNRVMTSPDGVNWTAQISAADHQWESVCWAPELGLFCAPAVNASQVMTSTDGSIWALRAAPTSASWSSVCWAPEIGLFCVTGRSGTNRTMTSPDGITWTLGPGTSARNWYSVCWAPELGFFCTVSDIDGGSGNSVMLSSPVYPSLYSSVDAVYFPYLGTTASAANVYLNTSSTPLHQVLIASSSLRYKTNIEDLDPARTAAVLEARPVSYNSLALADAPDLTHYGLIAEELAQIEPRLVNWAWAEPEYETVTLDDGTTETRETKPRQLIPDGVQYDRLPVFLLHYLKQQKTTIEALRARLAALKAQGGTP